MNKIWLSKWGLGFSSVAAFAAFIGAVNQFDQSKPVGEPTQSTDTENGIAGQTQNFIDPVKEEWQKENMEYLNYQPERNKEHDHEYEEDHEYEYGDHEDDDEYEHEDEEREYRANHNASMVNSSPQLREQVRVVPRTRAS